MCTRCEIRDRYIRPVWEKFISDWIYNETDRYILTRKFLDGVTYGKIVEELRATEYTPLEIDQVKRRYHAAEERLFLYAENAKI